MHAIIQAAQADNVDLPTEFCWMPAGKSEVSAHTLGGGSFVGGVICDEQACRVIQASFAAMSLKGQRMFIDLNHNQGAAAGWITGFYWDSSRGIMAAVSWTPLGANALRGKEFVSFSPQFLCDEKTGRIGGLINNCVGGLVNSPAFSNMPALVAAKLFAPTGNLFEFYIRETNQS